MVTGVLTARNAFLVRQQALCEQLRWAPLRSERRLRLEAELAALMREELQRETAWADGEETASPDDPYGGRAPYWVDQ